MLKKVKYKVKLKLAKWLSIGPTMYYGFKSLKGEKLPLTRISNTTYIDSLEKLDISNNVFIGHFNFIDASNGLKIATGCQITNYVSILTHSSHNAIRLYGHNYPKIADKIGYNKAPVAIGAFTFIGPHTLIMPGTNIGKGSIVQAYSLVKGSFEDFAIIGGNPAKKIGDTRELDAKYLEEHPQLKEHYNSWN